MSNRELVEPLGFSLPAGLLVSLGEAAAEIVNEAAQKYRGRALLEVGHTLFPNIF